MSYTKTFKEDLKWHCIYHAEEKHSLTDEVLYSQSVEEAKYKGGFLVRDTYVDYTIYKEGTRTTSITFVPPQTESLKSSLGESENE